MTGSVLRHRVDPALHAGVERVRRPDRTPSTRSLNAQPSRSSSDARAARSSPNRPKDSRSSCTSPPVPHLRDDSVIALARNGSPLATSTPEDCGNGVSAGTASATTTDDALTIRRGGLGRARRQDRHQPRDLRGRDGQNHRVGVPVDAGLVAQRPAGCPVGSIVCTPARTHWIRLRGDEFVEQHLVAAAERAEHRPAGRRRQAVAGPRRSGWRRRGRGPPPRSARPRATRSSPPSPRTPRPAADPPTGRPPARRTGRPPARPPRDRCPGCQLSGRAGSASIRATVASSTSPATDAADDGIPATVSDGSGCSRCPL